MPARPTEQMMAQISSDSETGADTNTSNIYRPHPYPDPHEAIRGPFGRHIHVGRIRVKAASAPAPRG